MKQIGFDGKCENLNFAFQDCRQKFKLQNVLFMFVFVGQ